MAASVSARPLSTDRDVLLFFEDRERDTLFKNDRHIRRAIRRFVLARLPGSPKVTGFEVWFRLLVRALERIGVRVHVNDRSLARQNPSFPVGLSGFTHVIDGWDLPNPALLGPGLYDHPALRPQLMSDPRFRLYITTCPWIRDTFAPVYGADRCVDWHGGIDLDEWPDTANRSKDIDVIIYDKIRWNREHYREVLIEPVRRALAARGLSSITLRYWRYDHDRYRRLLRGARAMIFLCEHETQGMAYQEAMASNLPILAWDPGRWMDPQAARCSSVPIPTCSVPFFSDECGLTFKRVEELEDSLDRFWAQLDSYRPRAYVARELSLEQSARTYLAHLKRAGQLS